MLIWSPPDTGDSAQNGETGGENSGDSNPTRPASSDSASRSGGSASASVVTINGNAGGEHASEVSDSAGVGESVGSVAGDKGLLMQQLTQLVQTNSHGCCPNKSNVCSGFTSNAAL